MKTILDCTNKVKNIISDSRHAYHKGKFYYYVYTHSINGKVFYIGKGSHDRAVRINGRSKLWYKTAFNQSVEVTIISELITQKEALSLENKYIQQYSECINIQFAKSEKIIRFDKKGIVIQIYNTVYDIPNDAYKKDCVIKCCEKERGLHKNYAWMYSKDYQENGFNYKKASNHASTIVQKDLKGIIVRELLTAAAFEIFGFNPKSIQQVCTNKKKTHLKYTFSYK